MNNLFNTILVLISLLLVSACGPAVRGGSKAIQGAAKIISKTTPAVTKSSSKLTKAAATTSIIVLPSLSDDISKITLNTNNYYNGYEDRNTNNKSSQQESTNHESNEKEKNYVNDFKIEIPLDFSDAIDYTQDTGEIIFESKEVLDSLAYHLMLR